MKLQKKYIQKYGISKRAWAVQRAAKRSPPRTPKRKSYSVIPMVRRKSKGGGFLGRAGKAYRSASSKINELAIVATALIEPYVDSIINSFSAIAGGLSSIIKLVAAYFLKKKGGMIGSIAQTIYVIEIYKLSKALVSGGGVSGLLGNIGNSNISAYV